MGNERRVITVRSKTRNSRELDDVPYLNNRLEVQHSVYDAVVYDSEVEREFAEKLDKREDIKLFVKLPDWFKIETSLGTYNPDWAILKDDDKSTMPHRRRYGLASVWWTGSV